MSGNLCEADDLLDIGHRARPVLVVGPGMADPVSAYIDGQHFYFDDATTAEVGAHLTGRVDLSGRLVNVERTGIGWREQRGWINRPLHHRRVTGTPVFRFDDEWLFTVVQTLPEQRRQRSNSSAHSVATSRRAGDGQSKAN